MPGGDEFGLGVGIIKTVGDDEVGFIPVDADLIPEIGVVAGADPGGLIVRRAGLFGGIVSGVRLLPTCEGPEAPSDIPSERQRVLILARHAAGSHRDRREENGLRPGTHPPDWRRIAIETGTGLWHRRSGRHWSASSNQQIVAMQSS